MKRLSFGGLIFALALGFLFLAFQTLVTPAEAAPPGAKKSTAAVAAKAKPTRTTPAKAAPNGDPDCITETAKAILEELSDQERREFLAEQLKITVLKLALDTQKNKSLTVERLVKQREADLAEKDVKGVMAELNKRYAEHGLKGDLEGMYTKLQGHRYRTNSKSKPWELRFSTTEIGAFVQARVVLQQNEIKATGKLSGIEYNQNDATILWHYGYMMDQLDRSDEVMDQLGQATRNMKEVSHRVAALTGYMAGIAAMSEKQILAEIANRKSKIAEFYKKVSTKVLVKIREKKKCPEDQLIASALCPNCEVKDVSASRETVNVEIIKQIMAKMMVPPGNPKVPDSMVGNLKKDDVVLNPDEIGNGQNADGSTAEQTEKTAKAGDERPEAIEELAGVTAKLDGKGRVPDADPTAEHRLEAVAVTAPAGTTSGETAGVTDPNEKTKEKPETKMKAPPATGPKTGEADANDRSQAQAQEPADSTETSETSEVKQSRRERKRAREPKRSVADHPECRNPKSSVRCDENGRAFTFTGIAIDHLKSKGQIVDTGMTIDGSAGCQLFFAESMAIGGKRGERKLYATIVKSMQDSQTKEVVNVILQTDQSTNIFLKAKGLVGCSPLNFTENGSPVVDLCGKSEMDTVAMLMRPRQQEFMSQCGVRP